MKFSNYTLEIKHIYEIKTMENFATHRENHHHITPNYSQSLEIMLRISKLLNTLY